ncbi:hypothetical protein F4679DRAFT_577959 [Xylaria curta]|nr:hypothetical protein F4679DRAFT_577959 [Xylaria curta]
MTTQMNKSRNDFGSKLKRRENQTLIKVDIEGFGYRLMGLDQLSGANVYHQVTVVISTLLDGILKSANKSCLRHGLMPKGRGIITYKIMEEFEIGVTLPLNYRLLAGAVEELKSGFYASLLVFTNFVLSDTSEEQASALDTALDKGIIRKGLAQFPSIDTILELPYQPQHSYFRPVVGRLLGY